MSPAWVDVWAVWLDVPGDLSGACRALLSHEEINRANQFAFEHLRRSHEVSHGVLRVLLAQYVKRHPRDLVFTFGPGGKPALSGDSRIRFNMSHSAGLAVYAITLDCEVGIDIEQVREIEGIEQIAEQHFCRAELSQLLSLAGDEPRREAFFRCWTRKEAYIKAIGDGLMLPLDQFQVTLLPDEPPLIVQIGNDRGTSLEWTLQHLEPAAGYTGALAYRAGARKISQHPPRQAETFLTWKLELETGVSVE